MANTKKKIKFNYFYVRAKEKKICVTDNLLDPSKCRKKFFKSKFNASEYFSKLLKQGYQRISVKEFKKLME